MQEKQYKVLVDARSWRENIVWSLPRLENDLWIPGDWHEVQGKVYPHFHGFTLTTNRFEQYKPGCIAYLAEGEGDRASCGHHGSRTSITWQRARLLRPVRHPGWWLEALQFCDSIATVPWFQNGDVKSRWQIHETRQDARHQLPDRDEAGSTLRFELWRDSDLEHLRGSLNLLIQNTIQPLSKPLAYEDAVRDATLMAWAYLKYRGTGWFDRVRRRWDVWQHGYGLYAELDNVFHVYRRPV